MAGEALKELLLVSKVFCRHPRELVKDANPSAAALLLSRMSTSA